MFGCSGCKEAWTGSDIAHCGLCHETFVSYRHFDHHRKAVRGGSHKGPMNRCISPQEAGMVLGGRGLGNHWILRPGE